MPVLDGLCALSVSDAALYLLSVIYCPRDGAERKALFARMQNTQTKIALNKGSRPAGWRIDQGASQLAGVGKRDSDRTTGATAAAFMFMRVLADEASLNSAIKELQKTHGRSAATYWANWDKFRPAAHLGAAFHFWRGLWHTDPPDLGKFLVIAEGLRQRGETHAMPPSSPRTFLLDPAETWRTPECVTLPHTSFEMPRAGDIRLP